MGTPVRVSTLGPCPHDTPVTLQLLSMGTPVRVSTLGPCPHDTPVGLQLRSMDIGKQERSLSIVHVWFL